MNIQQHEYPVAISQKLVAILTQELAAHPIDTSEGIIYNFRDPDYSGRC